MTYNFELATTAEINKTVIEEMISHAVEQQTGKKISSLEAIYNIDEKFTGYKIVFTHEEHKKPIASEPMTLHTEIDRTFKPLILT
jgi:hypothetical protein